MRKANDRTVMTRERRSRSTVRPATWAALALAVTASGTLAQQEGREGQFLAVGLGPGVDHITCDICAGDPRPGVAGFLRFGGTLSPRLLLGAELDGSTREREGARLLLGSLSAVVLLYPDADARVHAKLGAGVVGFRSSEDGDALTSLAPGVTGGIGYDLPITPSVSLTPFAHLILAPYARLDFNGDEAVTGATLAFLQGGLGITWH